MSIEKIETNLAEAGKAIKTHEDKAQELTKLITHEKGLAKKELQKVLKKENEAKKEIEDHVSKGKALLSE